MRTRRIAFAALALVAAPFAGACADEDGDGATTDEEVEDVRQGGERVENEVKQEVEGQNQGSNEDGE